MISFYQGIENIKIEQVKLRGEKIKFAFMTEFEYQ